MTHTLRVLISADMEGISGIVHPAETQTAGPDYERGRALMTADVNAVIDGVLANGGPATVLVSDARGTFRNLQPEQLHRSARLLRGRPRPLQLVVELGQIEPA